MTRMTRRLFGALPLAVLAAASFAAPAAAQERHVAITQITEHPALDAVRKGVVDELADKGMAADKDYVLTFANAQGNPANASQIARRFAGLGADVIVAISTPSSQQVAAVIKDTPIVFGAVTDPVAAGLVKDREHPEGNVTGISSLAPIGRQLDLLTRIVPGIKTVGVLYNPGEANSVVLVDLLKKEAESRGMAVEEAAVTTSAETSTAARSLADKVDTIYIPNDNTVVQGLEAIVKVGRENRIPILAGDTGSVERGALASIGFSYYDIGREVGQRVFQVLEGTPVADIPVRQVERVEIFLNKTEAGELGIEIPQALIDEAKKVY